VARRGIGEGSVYRRKDGKPVGEIRWTDDDGQRQRIVVYGKTLTEARTKLKAAIERIEDGAPVRDSGTKIAAFLEEWISGALEASKRARATKDHYATMVRKHVIPALGEKRLRDLRPTHVEQLLVAKAAEGLSDVTVRHVYTSLRQALEIAVRDKLVRENVVNKVDRPAVGKKDAAYLTQEQAHALLLALACDPLIEGLARLMLLTGLRRGEALGLRWEDVDTEEEVLLVRKSLTRASDGLKLRDVKTEKSRRTIAYGEGVATVLRARRKAQIEDRLRAGGSWDNEQGLIFTTALGGALEPRNVLRRFDKVARDAGFPEVHLHTLRHSAASLLLRKGHHMKVVQEILGHSTFAVTAEVYSHVAPVQAREASAGLDAAFG
jgi:integrase